jgi:hypothetical protein
MTIRFEIPPHIAQVLEGDGVDLNGAAKEAWLVELYREERISHRELGEALGLCRYDTDGVLKRHQVSPNVTAREMQAQASALGTTLPRALHQGEMEAISLAEELGTDWAADIRSDAR